jgi:uncharacterized protein YbaP (TraB family)
MKKIIFFLISMIYVFNVNAQNSEQKDNSLVWKITNKDSKKNSYIVFTSASMCKSNPALISKVSHLLDEIKIYYTETGIGNAKNEKESQKYAFLNSSGQSVKEILSNDIYIQLKGQILGLKLPDSLDKLNPVMVNSILMRTITPKCNVSNITELIFRKYAEKYNIEVRDLLTVQDAFKILNSYGNSYYADQIQYTLLNKEKVASDITRKAELYMNEDLKGIQKLYTQSTFLNARYVLKNLEKERTDLLVSKIKEVVKNGDVLITLDLACIMNDGDNLFSALRNMGYDLNAVN